MVIINKRLLVLVRKDVLVDHNDNENVQVVIETRKPKDNESEYTNAPDREIMKWIETRAI